MLRGDMKKLTIFERLVFNNTLWIMASALAFPFNWLWRKRMQFIFGDCPASPEKHESQSL